jgi:hypothetical protein
MMSDDRPYTFIRTLDAKPSQLLVRGEFQDLGAQFEAAAASTQAPHYIPVEVEVVRNWAEYRSGNESPDSSRVFILGSEAHVEPWILNVAAVLSLTPAEVEPG